MKTMLNNYLHIQGILSLRVVPHENYRARDLNLNANEASKRNRIVIDVGHQK